MKESSSYSLDHKQGQKESRQVCRRGSHGVSRVFSFMEVGLVARGGPRTSCGCAQVIGQVREVHQTNPACQRRWQGSEKTGPAAHQKRNLAGCQKSKFHRLSGISWFLLRPLRPLQSLPGFGSWLLRWFSVHGWSRGEMAEALKAHPSWVCQSLWQAQIVQHTTGLTTLRTWQSSCR